MSVRYSTPTHISTSVSARFATILKLGLDGNALSPEKVYKPSINSTLQPQDMLTSLRKIPIVMTIDGKRKLDETADLQLELVRALVTATLQWTTHKKQNRLQIYRDTMHHTVVRNAQGGFEVNVHFRFARSEASTEKDVTFALPAPFEAPPDPLTQQVDDNTYDALEQAIWSYLKGKNMSLYDLESFGPELTNLIKTVLNDGPWKDLDIQKPRIRLHRDGSTKSPKWHNDASNPNSEEVVTFYVRHNPNDNALDDERMPRFVKGPVPWVDMEETARSVLRAVWRGKSTFISDDLDFNGGPLDSLKSTYDRYIKDGINAGYFTLHPWPKNAFVRVSGTFHVGPPPRPTRQGQSQTDERKGRIFIAFRTGRTVADSMKDAALEQSS